MRPMKPSILLSSMCKLKNKNKNGDVICMRITCYLQSDIATYWPGMNNVVFLVRGSVRMGIVLTVVICM